MAAIPPYFINNPDYKTWSLHAFLASELPPTTTTTSPIDNATKRRLGDAWNSTLLHYAADEKNPRRAGWAERLRREWKDKSTNSQAAFNSWIQGQDPFTSTPASTPVSSVASSSAATSSVAASMAPPPPPPAPPSRAPRKSHKLPRVSPLSRVSAPTSSAASVDPDDSISNVLSTSSSSSATSGVLAWCIPSPAELQAQYDAMKNKSRVEAVVHRRAVEACARGAGFDAAMLWVVDEGGRKAVREAIEKEVKEKGEGEKGEVGEGEGEIVEVGLPEIPEVPEGVVKYLERFREKTQPIPTLAVILQTASQPHADLFTSPTDTDKMWIDDAMKFAYRLTAARFLALPLLEGCYDSSVHPVFWQNYFLEGPVWVQQKETKLPTPDPASPLAALRWDGVFLPKRALVNGTRPAFGLMEVCRDIGSDAAKSRRDWLKLMVGLREILRVLRSAVEGNGTGKGKGVEGLAVVGVLLTGAQTTVMVMSCAGENLYSVVEGGTHVFPTEMDGLVDGVARYLKPIWRAKEIMVRSHRIVEECFREREYVI